jgi:hypothetical protein
LNLQLSSQEDFERLRTDVAHVGGIAREMTQGDTYTQRILLDDHALTDAAEVRAFVDSRRYRNLLSYVAGKNHPALVYLHRIRNGFHGRGDATPGETRFEIWAYNRRHPFNPLPGFGLGFLGKLECAAMQAWWRRLDRKAAKRGAQATWHLIDRQAVIRADYQTPDNQ